MSGTYARSGSKNSIGIRRGSKPNPSPARALRFREDQTSLGYQAARQEYVSKRGISPSASASSVGLTSVAESMGVYSDYTPASKHGASPEDLDRTAKGALRKSLADERAVIHGEFVRLLAASGLERTAACLRKEAGLPQDSGAGGTSSLPKAMERVHALDNASTDDQKLRMAALKEEMVTQRSRMEALNGIVKGLRGRLEEAAKGKLEERAAMLAQQQKLKAAIDQRRAEVEQLKKEFETTITSTSKLESELSAAEENLERLKNGQSGDTHAPEAGMDLFDKLDANHDGQVSREEFEQGVKAILAEAQKLRALLNTWDDANGGRKEAEIAFREVDIDSDGKLGWENDEIKHFVKSLFTRTRTALPPWAPHVWQDLYRGADLDNSKSLELDEAVRFARHCLEMTLRTCLRSPAVSTAFYSDPVTLAEQWARNYIRHPATVQHINYRNGMTVDILEVASTLQPLVMANAKHRHRMLKVIELGEHIQTALQAYRLCDRDGNGTLTWNNSEIRNFVGSTFRTHGLSVPVEDQMYGIYSRFDADRNCALDAIECMEMADVLFRAVFIAEPSMRATTQQVTREMAACGGHSPCGGQSPGGRFGQTVRLPRAASPGTQTIMYPPPPHPASTQPVPTLVSGVFLAPDTGAPVRYASPGGGAAWRSSSGSPQNATHAAPASPREHPGASSPMHQGMVPTTTGWFTSWTHNSERSRSLSPQGVQQDPRIATQSTAAAYVAAAALSPQGSSSSLISSHPRADALTTPVLTRMGSRAPTRMKSLPVAEPQVVASVPTSSQALRHPSSSPVMSVRTRSGVRQTGTGFERVGGAANLR